MEKLNGWPWEVAVDPKIYSAKINWPKISIITPSFNQGNYIEETILSIIKQNYPNLEYIIIDGGSSDQTLDIIKNYENQITYWISEKDTGQAHAINKGFKIASGKIVNWLNSDDILAPSSLFNIAENFDDETDIIAGNVIDFKNNFEILHHVENKNLNLSSILRINQSNHVFHQPGVWFNKKNLDLINPLNEALHYQFDWEFTLRYLYLFPRVNYLNKTLVFFRYHKDSKTVSKREEFFKDSVEVFNSLALFTVENPKMSLKAHNKAYSLFWNHSITQFTQRNRTKNRFVLFLYVLYEILKRPDKRTTRFTIGLLRKILSREI
ncbi:glycosyltransferase family 2 protein [Daejeonella oryzae]|uniref:glycosyltransferase family 2 protein n=1 Tax=Daejeonella oryzae TaxID=1122943 RepID=UPI00041AAB58|nr:glycosyltransferase family 2 protein [Daejeonella oryzae]